MFSTLRYGLISRFMKHQGHDDQSVHGNRGGKTKTGYHGTSSKSLKSILKNGIVSDSQKRMFDKAFYAGREDAVFFSDSKEHARTYAKRAAKKEGCKYAIVKVSVPADKVHVDDADQNRAFGKSYYVRGKIDKSWIVGYETEQDVEKRKYFYVPILLRGNDESE